MKTTKKLLVKGLVSKRKLPVNYQNKDFPFFNKEFIKPIDNTYIYELNNVYVTEDGVVFKNFQIFKHSLHQTSHIKWLNKTYILFTFIFKKRIKKEGTYLLGFNYWGEGYYHWILEEFPRLFCSLKIKEEHTVLIPSTWKGFYSFRTMVKSFVKRNNSVNNNYHKRSIDLLNLKKILFISKNSYLKVEKLLVVSYTASSGNYNDILIREINRFFYKPIVQLNYSNKFDNIYISRKKANRRKIINEDEVETLLLKNNFKCLVFEDYSFDEQIALAANCNTLISLHGAGLSNLLFMKENTNIIELRAQDDTQNLCYFSLASALNVNYYYLFCDKNNNELSVQDADIFVDIIKLKKIIKQIK